MFPFDELHHGVNKMVNALRLLIHKETPAPYGFICNGRMSSLNCIE